MQKKRLLNLLLTNGSGRIPKKSQIVNHVSTGLNVDVQIAGGWDSIRIELHPSEWEENFRMSRESFLVLCTELNGHIVKSIN